MTMRVVIRRYWNELGESSESILSEDSRPVGVFHTREAARDFIQKKMEDHPEHLVYENEYGGLTYEDGGHEIDSYEIWDLEVSG